MWTPRQRAAETFGVVRVASQRRETLARASGKRVPRASGRRLAALTTARVSSPLGAGARSRPRQRVSGPVGGQEGRWGSRERRPRMRELAADVHAKNSKAKKDTESQCAAVGNGGQAPTGPEKDHKPILCENHGLGCQQRYKTNSTMWKHVPTCPFAPAPPSGSGGLFTVFSRCGGAVVKPSPPLPSIFLADVADLFHGAPTCTSAQPLHAPQHAAADAVAPSQVCWL